MDNKKGGRLYAQLSSGYRIFKTGAERSGSDPARGDCFLRWEKDRRAGKKRDFCGIVPIFWYEYRTACLWNLWWAGSVSDGILFSVFCRKRYQQSGRCDGRTTFWKSLFFRSVWRCACGCDSDLLSGKCRRISDRTYQGDTGGRFQQPDLIRPFYGGQDFVANSKKYCPERTGPAADPEKNTDDLRSAPGKWRSDGKSDYGWYGYVCHDFKKNR